MLMIVVTIMASVDQVITIMYDEIRVIKLLTFLN